MGRHAQGGRSAYAAGMTDVEALLSELDHPRADDIRALCTAMSTAFPGFTDEVKWNAPSYRSGTVNLVTLRILPPPNFQVILHVGSKKPVSTPDLRFDIDGVRHAWADQARGILYIDQVSDIPPTIAAVTRWHEGLSEHGLV